jgi:hypothetical protein
MEDSRRWQIGLLTWAPLESNFSHKALSWGFLGRWLAKKPSPSKSKRAREKLSFWFGWKLAAFFVWIFPASNVGRSLGRQMQPVIEWQVRHNRAELILRRAIEE